MSLLKTKSRETVGVEQIQQALAPSAVLLEYIIAEPNSYCLTISRNGARIAGLGSKARIEALVAAYLKAVKTKLPLRLSSATRMTPSSALFW